MRRIIDHVAADPELPWNETTRDQTFPMDANAILESLIAEYGVEATLVATRKQGFHGDYRYAVERLHKEAVARRAKRNES
jgi:hypothetical protein